MLVARPRSRLVKLISAIASTIGRASKLVMSICLTCFESSSALRVSLIGGFAAAVLVRVSVMGTPIQHGRRHSGDAETREGGGAHAAPRLPIRYWSAVTA